MIVYRLRYFSTPLILCGLFLTMCAPGEPTQIESAIASPQAKPFQTGNTNFGLTFRTPDGWIQETPSSSMRVAQFKLSREGMDREDAEFVVFYFGGQGGSARANVERWIGQFSQADGSPANEVAQVDERDANAIHLTIVDVSGTYVASGGPMMRTSPPKPNYRLLAAVAEATGGPWFLKLTGPRATVDKWEKSFHELLETLAVNH